MKYTIMGDPSVRKLIYMNQSRTLAVEIRSR